MSVLPPFDPPANSPNYWSISTLSFNRSAAYPQNQEYWNVFPNDIQVFDLNGDGHLDVLQIYSYIPDQYRPGIPVRILLGNGRGGFADATSTLFPTGAPLGNAATGVSVADFNGDGVKDVFISVTWETANIKDAQNVLILSDGLGGVFNATSRLPVLNDYSHWSSAGDVEGDGDIDIFVCNIAGDQSSPNGDTSSYFLINSGDGHFARSDARLPAQIESGYQQFTSSLLFDADGDGDKDLLLGMWGPQAALQNTGATASLVLFNNGSGSFSQTAKSALPAPLFSVDKAEVLDMEAIDLNGDGALDLLLLMHNQSARGVQALINNGDGTFRDETSTRISASEANSQFTGRYLNLADINGDAVKDLVLQTGGPSRFFLNDGAGHFVALPADFLFTNSPSGGYAFVPGDFDEDGRTDMFVRTIVNSWDDPQNVTEFDWVALWRQPSTSALNGDGSANAVLGSNLAETLTGFAGNDVLFGGGGTDTFRDTSANLSGDTILDFTRGDRIVLTDAAVGSNLGWNGSALTYGTTSLTLSNLHNASITAGPAAGGGVQIVYGGPPLITAASASVSVAASAAVGAGKAISLAAELMPDTDWSLPVETHFFRPAGDYFAIA